MSTQTGTLSGLVTRGPQQPIPGVTVTLTGQGAPQVQVTIPPGTFKFRELQPGSYTLTAQLEGFNTSTFPGIVIYAGRDTGVEIPLSPADS